MRDFSSIDLPKMLTRGGEGVKKHEKHANVICERPLIKIKLNNYLISSSVMTVYCRQKANDDLGSTETKKLFCKDLSPSIIRLVEKVGEARNEATASTRTLY